MTSAGAVASVSAAVAYPLNRALDWVCLRFLPSSPLFFLFEQRPEGVLLPCVYINGQISAGYGFKYRGKEQGGSAGLTTITTEVFPNPLWLLCKANTCPALPAECEKW